MLTVSTIIVLTEERLSEKSYTPVIVTVGPLYSAMNAILLFQHVLLQVSFAECHTWYLEGAWASKI